MGAHSGPIKEVADVNDRANFAGGGLNIAQRVLDCGDAGHILVSNRIAEDLKSYRHWNAHLHDLGVCEVKHGLRLHLYNLCKDGLGNPAVPEKITCQRGRWQRLKKIGARSPAKPWQRTIRLALLLLALIGAATAGWMLWHRAPETRAKGIAVLPFANQSDDKSNEYFVDGVQDEILTDLSKVADLKVISRASVMQFKAGGERNLHAIADALGVSHILQGSVQKVNNRVRVHAQLVEGRTAAQIWSDDYDGELADVLGIQSNIAKQIAGQLKLRLSAEVKAAIEEPPTRDFAAYDAYVRAKSLVYSSLFSTRAREELLEAVQLLTQAVTRDPNFFLSYYQLAQAHDELYRRFERERTPERLHAAEAAIDVLRRLRPESGETHLAIAQHVDWIYGDHVRAKAELEIAQKKLANEAAVPLAMAGLDRREGRWDESLRGFQRALELEPQNPLTHVEIAMNYFQMRRFPEMADVLERALQIEPNNLHFRALRAQVEVEWHANTAPLHALIEATVSGDPAGAAAIADRWMDLALYEQDAAGAARAVNFLGEDGCKADAIPFPHSWCEGMAARIRGDEEAARAAFVKTRAEVEKRARTQPEDAGALCVLGMAEAMLGDKDAAIENGKRAVQLLPTNKDAVNGPLLLGYLAIIYAWTGEKNLAFARLEDATNVPSFWSYGNLRLHPYWAPLRDDPRFEKILESLASKS
ncbi:MAG: hypothetical protein M3Z22_06210, partial [Verrucomicrobiota bacterium]|nr:hypothetical protein [Verrucomicrobiota bacterium]